MKILSSENTHIEGNIFTLAFSGVLEKEYLNLFYTKSIRHVRLSLLLAIFIYSVFGVLDHWIVPEVRDDLWFIRFALFCPYVILIYIFSYTEYFKKYMQLSIYSVVLFAGIGIIAMILIAPYPSNYSYYAGLILVFLYGYTFFKLRFIWATFAGWAIVISYEFAAIFLTNTPIEILISNNFFFLSGNFIGMIAGYSIEFYSRRDFLQTRLLEEEKKKVDAARQNLELRVEERTTQLVTVNEELINKISEQIITEEALRRRVDSEQLITTLSTQFIHLQFKELEDGMKNTVKAIGEFAQVCCSDLYLYKSNSLKDQPSFELFHKWENENSNFIDTFTPLDLSWTMTQLEDQKPVIIEDVDDFPKNAHNDRNMIASAGIKSIIIMPLMSKNNLVGFIGFDSMKDKVKWSKEKISLLKIVGDLLVLAYERKNTEELLQQSEKQYQTLFEKSRDVVFISTPEGNFIDMNPAGLDLFGYSSKEEILKINIAKDLYANPEDRQKFRTIIDRDGHITEFEFKLKTKDGKNLIAVETATALRDKSGKILVYQGIIRDITKKRKLEQQLFQSQKMDSIGMLAGGIAHDFNNILTALRGYSDLALMKMPENSVGTNEISGISRGIERAEDLTRQLLAFSRKQIIEPHVININKVIINLEKMMRRLIGEDINLKTILSGDIDHIKADPGQIEQILVNLVINARDAINQIDIKTQDKKITIETKQIYLDFNYIVNHPEVKVGDYLLIAVSDTGSGMKDETISKIFEPFYTTKSNGKGTGLGLSTVYGIVKQNNGNIYVYSEPNKGSTFKIYWPTTDLDIVAEYKDEPSEEMARGEETILFVEDDDEVRKFMNRTLKTLQYNTFEACNGLEALEIVRRNKLKLDLLITDVIMPEMGGKELAEEIVKFVPGIKILFTSGYTDNHIVRSGRLDQGINFLQKPFSIKEISKKIRYILEN